MLACILTLLVSGSSAFAHNIWINPMNHFPKVGETVDIGLGWGHTYPANRVDQEMKQGNVSHVTVFDPDGVKLAPVMVNETLYRLKIEKPGAYLVTAGIKPGIFTKTTEGRVWSDKKGVKNPISCTSFSIEAKAIIIAGGEDKNLSFATGQELEVIPLSNPANLKSGDKFSFMVLFRGKATQDITVNATYAGYTDGEKAKDAASHKGQPKSKDKKNHFPASTITDSQGKAIISLGKAGFWMMTLSHKTPYPDPDICDEYMHNMAFTMEIR